MFIDIYKGLVILYIGMITTIVDLAVCKECGWLPLEEPADFLLIGLWPTDLKQLTFMEFSYMQYNSTLQHMSPSLSLSSMLQTLTFITTFSGEVSQNYLYKMLCQLA